MGFVVFVPLEASKIDSATGKIINQLIKKQNEQKHLTTRVIINTHPYKNSSHREDIRSHNSSPTRRPLSVVTAKVSTNLSLVDFTQTPHNHPPRLVSTTRQRNKPGDGSCSSAQAQKRLQHRAGSRSQQWLIETGGMHLTFSLRPLT